MDLVKKSTLNFSELSEEKPELIRKNLGSKVGEMNHLEEVQSHHKEKKDES